MNFNFQDCFQRSLCPELTWLGFQPVASFNDCVCSTFLLEISWLHFVSHAYLVTGRGTYSLSLILLNFYIFMLRNAVATRGAHTVSLLEERLLTLRNCWVTPEISFIFFFPVISNWHASSDFRFWCTDVHNPFSSGFWLFKI